MSGRREQQKQVREARILAAAEELFAGPGYAATGMSEVARRAGLAVGTLYNYFASKPEILLAIVRRDTAEGLARAEEVLKAPPGDPVDAVHALLEHSVAPFERHERALWRQLLAASMSEPALAGGLFASDVRLIALLTTLLRELETNGHLRPGVEAGRAAVALYALYLTWFMAWVSNDASALDDVRAELRGGIELVMYGLLARARERGERS